MEPDNKKMPKVASALAGLIFLCVLLIGIGGLVLAVAKVKHEPMAAAFFLLASSISFSSLLKIYFR